MITPIHDHQRQFATFYLDGHLCGIEVLKVQEVIPFQEMTAVPLAPESVEGLINLRGQIALAINTRYVMGLPVRQQVTPPLNLVVRLEDGIASLLVDDIGDVVNVEPSMRAAVPDTLPARQQELIECVYMLRDGLMLALNVNDLLDRVSQETSRINPSRTEGNQYV